MSVHSSRVQASVLTVKVFVEYSLSLKSISNRSEVRTCARDWYITSSNEAVELITSEGRQNAFGLGSKNVNLQ